MRIGKAFQVAMVVAAWFVWQSGVAAAQPAEAPVAVIGPLYAYGPAPVAVDPPRYRARQYRPQYDNPGYQPRPRYEPTPYRGYGYRPYQPYRGYGYRPAPGYRSAAPYWYGWRRSRDYAHQRRYAARILTPRWNSGPQPPLGTVYNLKYDAF